MSFEQLKSDWNALGADDPLWAVLTDASRRGGRWNPDEFFATGVADVELLRARAAEIGVPIVGGRALDFGCGVGRLSQALAPHLAQVDGVDIAPSMIELARRFDRSGGRCRFHVNPDPDLRAFENDAFDLVFSRIVLQHMPPALSRGYLREFVRVLRPGGLLAFQLPARYPRTVRGFLYGVMPVALRQRVWRLRQRHPIEMHPVPRRVVEGDLAAVGATLHRAFPDESCGPEFESWFYFATKPARPAPAFDPTPANP